ncbi:sigma-70 family RNA polymerase sigma factor [Kaarinaea lacus]
MTTQALNKQAPIEQIYRDYREPVYNYIYRLSNDPNQAQDVAQQTFLKIMIDPGLSDVENIKSYLFTIARNHLYDTWKKKKETLVDDAGIDIAASADESELTEELARKQTQKAVTFCVQRLTDKFRELMILRYMQDLSIQEIASITQLSQSDIKVSLLRARQQFDKGLTQHMYLKVAKSRQQCTEMNSMLAVYKDVDIPEAELAAFEKHIDKCLVCTEDAEELKRTRKLLALIPLATVPLSLDTSFNDAMAASVPDANTAGNTLLVKGAVSAAVVALIAGVVLLLPDKQPINTPTDASKVDPQLPQTVKSQVQQQPKQSQPPAQAVSAGSVSMTAKARLTTGAAPVSANWELYKLSADGKTVEQSLNSARGEELSRKLDPGQYRIKARIDSLEQERKIEVVEGNPLSLNFIFNASKVHVSTPLTSTINLHDSHLTYLIFKSRQDMESGKYVALKRFTQPASTFILRAGEYYLKASYLGFGKIEAVKSFTVREGNSVVIEIPIEVGMFKPEAILTRKNLPHIRNISWSITEPSVPENASTRFSIIKNGTEMPMASGTYTLTAKLENITQQSEITIKAGQVTPHKVIFRGGIVKAAVWLDKPKSERNKDIYLNVYESEKYRSASQQGDYVPTIAVIRNDMPDESAILPEGNYALVIKNNIDHKVRATRDFTVKDGDTKQLDLIITEEVETK